MAKLTRVTGKVFGSAALAQTGGIGQFGSAATGTPNPTTDVATIQALQAYLNGWGSAVITSRNFPPIEEVTGVLKTISYQACYTLQEGIPEYDINTEYSNTSIVKGVNNGVITLYSSLTNNNQNNPLSDSTKWKATELSFDGTWTYVDTACSTTTSLGSHDITSSVFELLPDNTKSYQCLFRYINTVSGSSQYPRTNRSYSFLVNSYVMQYDNIDPQGSTSTGDTIYHSGQFSAIISPTDTISISLSGNSNQKLASQTTTLLAYRRLG